MSDVYNTKSTLETKGGAVSYYSLPKLAEAGVGHIDKLPYSIKVLLEAALRNYDDFQVSKDDIDYLASWKAKDENRGEVPFKPGRVILQDFTGVPSVVDLAALRSAMKALGGDPKKINPRVPCDLVIDHSIQVDHFGKEDAMDKNVATEFSRNQERYEFLRWGAQAFDNFRVVPPSMGIVHQVNLEYLAKGVLTKEVSGEKVAFPDSLVGTDSHTTMINGLGVVGWGVGGIEAEAVMLDQPIYMLAPDVVGFKLYGKLPEGATATDLVLTVVEKLRQKGVVGKFVEFFGEGVSAMSLPDRATLANMGPEYGATMGFFPIDQETLDFLRRTGRTEEEVDLVEQYTKAQGLFRTDEGEDPEFTDVVALDMGTVVPSLAGPKRPQDRIELSNMQSAFQKALVSAPADGGLGVAADNTDVSTEITCRGKTSTVNHGSLAFAAITSCTNTSNPSVMMAAGLVAKKACEKGLTTQGHVKTSLAPGSQVVSAYLDAAGLTPFLDQLGFHTVGYGCTTCIGNCGPVQDELLAVIEGKGLVAASVLSGNRNFEGRIGPHSKANYLASPPLVVAYALAGSVDFDLEHTALGKDAEGNDVFLKDIWPSSAEVQEALGKITPAMFQEKYGNVFEGNETWNNISVSGGDLFEWNEASTYVQEPPFFQGLTKETAPIAPIAGARALALLGDSVTTDHISPAGAIKADGPAGQFLQDRGVAVADFNSFGSRRGNDRVMTRGTFANVRIRNQLAPGTEGGVTTHLGTNEQMSIYDAAMKYKEEGTPLVVLAGKEYGTGSSRDWAAKGTFLLGIKAVMAESFERIHRSNLVGMGVLPLQFLDGQSPASLGLTGKEHFDIAIDDNFKAGQKVTVTAKGENGEQTFEMQARVDTPVEVDYYRNGGILHTVLRSFVNEG